MPKYWRWTAFIVRFGDLTPVKGEWVEIQATDYEMAMGQAKAVLRTLEPGEKIAVMNMD